MTLHPPLASAKRSRSDTSIGCPEAEADRPGPSARADAAPPNVSTRTYGGALALLVLLASACGSDSPASPSDETGGHVRRDAGSTKRHDAGRAETSGEDDSSDDDSSNDDSSNDDSSDDDSSATAEHAPDARAATHADAGAKGADGGTKGSADAGAGSDAVSCDTLTYASFGKAFVTTYCTECHNSSSATSSLGNIALDTLPLIVKNKGILKRVVVPQPDGREPAMPKGGNDKLTDAERTKFGAWIDCGPM